METILGAILSSRTRLRSLAAVIGVFLIMATALARTKSPWCDEGWFANPAYNLAFHGQMGTNVLEPSGHFLNAYLSGIRSRTYIVVPNHIVALAGWFRLFGFSLFTMRAYSILWGAAGLCCLFYILEKLFPDPRVAQWGTFFTAIDFVYLWSSADGRMESSTSALALASLVAYLHFRERSVPKAIFASQSLAAIAVFAHPNALLVLLAVPAVIWRLDRRRTRFRHLFLAAAPYLFFGILWGLYILKSPGDFSAQFFANAVGRNGNRFYTVIRPWLAIWPEIARHLGTYSLSTIWAGEMKQRTVLVPLLYMAAVISFVFNRRSYPASVRTFLACLLTVILSLTFLNGFKACNYLIYFVPFYGAALAFWLLNLSRHGPVSRVLAVALGIGFISLQLWTSVDHVRADEYHVEYAKTIERLTAERAAGKTILGTSALGFGLGFHGFDDDWRLGLYSGLKPDILVLDRSYRYFAEWFETDEPRVFSHLVSTLTSDYRLSARYGNYWIFERVKSTSESRASWVDISGLSLKPEGERAEYLFKQLSTNEPTSNASLTF